MKTHPRAQVVPAANRAAAGSHNAVIPSTILIPNAAARRLREQLTRQGVTLRQGHALELISLALGQPSYNHLTARGALAPATASSCHAAAQSGVRRSYVAGTQAGLLADALIEQMGAADTSAASRPQFNIQQPGIQQPGTQPASARNVTLNAARGADWVTWDPLQLPLGLCGDGEPGWTRTGEHIMALGGPGARKTSGIWTPIALHGVLSGAQVVELSLHEQRFLPAEPTLPADWTDTTTLRWALACGRRAALVVHESDTWRMAQVLEALPDLTLLEFGLRPPVNGGRGPRWPEQTPPAMWSRVRQVTPRTAWTQEWDALHWAVIREGERDLRPGEAVDEAVRCVCSLREGPPRWTRLSLGGVMLGEGAAAGRHFAALATHGHTAVAEVMNLTQLDDNHPEGMQVTQHFTHTAAFPAFLKISDAQLIGTQMGVTERDLYRWPAGHAVVLGAAPGVRACPRLDEASFSAPAFEAATDQDGKIQLQATAGAQPAGPAGESTPAPQWSNRLHAAWRVMQQD